MTEKITCGERTLIAVRSEADIPEVYRGTAIADLLAYHNLGAEHRKYVGADILVGMCMDNRKRISVPENFAYIMRAAGANFTGLEFQSSFAVGVGGVKAIALIGHDNCGMSGLEDKREQFVEGLESGAGWSTAASEEHFDLQAPRFEVGDPAAFIVSQATHFRSFYPALPVAPMFYLVGDHRLYLVDEDDA